MVEAMDFLFTLLIPIKKPAETDLRSCEPLFGYLPYRTTKTEIGAYFAM